MPKVPTIESNSRLRPLGSPNVQDNSNVFNYTSGASKAVAAVLDTGVNIANDIEKINQKEREKANDVWSMDYDAKTLRAYNDLLHSEKDGALTTKRGEEAINATNGYAQRFAKTLDELEQTASNDDQRFIARKIRQKRENDLREAYPYQQRHLPLQKV